MGTLLKFSGILGTVLFLFGLVGAILIGSFSQPLMLAHIVVGALLLGIWFFSAGAKNIGQAGDAIKGRKIRFGTNVFLYAAVFVGILVAANWFANRHDKRWDLTKEGAFSLSNQSEQIIKNLKAPLKLVALTGNPQVDEGKIQELFDLYKYANPSKVSTELVDPRTKPHLIDKYGFKQGNAVYVGYGEEDKQQVNRLNDFSEEAITNAILKLARGASKKIYYVQGHDEPALENEEQLGLKAFADSIGDENFSIEGLIVSQKENIPDDAAAVILCSPKKPMLQAERESLINYADKGGRLLLFSDPRTTDDVKQIAAHFGIELGNNVIIDQIQRLFAGPALGAQPIVRDYAVHPVTKNLSKSDITIFNIASTVRPAAQKNASATYTELLKSSITAWGESDLAAMFDTEDPSATFDKEKDLAGPVTLAVAFENRIADDKKDADPSKDQDSADPKFNKVTRVVVFGDSDWVLNANLQVYSNRDLALNSVNWLVGEEGGISIRPRQVGSSAAPIPNDTFMLILATSFLVPEFILIFGLFIWWRRRSVGA